MPKFTNKENLSLPLAVWLANKQDYNDGSDQHVGKSLISATTLLKSTRQLVLSSRIPEEEQEIDVADLIAARVGDAIHNSIEEAWKDYKTGLANLGFKDSYIDKLVVNPFANTVADDKIPVHTEIRGFKEIDVQFNGKSHKVVISGKIDFIIDRMVVDTKTTSVWSYLNDNKDEDYQRQMSIYRWIFEDRVDKDFGIIQFVFTDWSRAQKYSRPDYPNRVAEKKIPLLDIAETEAFIRNKIVEIAANQHLPEEEIVHCTDKELWRSEPLYKYYSDPAKAVSGGRATKNFDNFAEANLHASQKGKGVVITVPGKVKACGYCPAFNLCSQKNQYELE